MYRRIVIFCLLAILLTTAGCGGGQSTPAAKSSGAGKVSDDGHITIEFWYPLSGKSGQVIEDLVKQFNESQTEITVVSTYQGGYGPLMAKLWSAISAGNPPATALVGAAPLLGNTGSIVAVTEYLDQSEGIDRSQIYPAFWEYNSAGGKIWSMPFNHSLPLLYYNRDLFSAAGLDPNQPPEDWEQVVELGQKLTLDTDNNGKIDQWGFNTSDDTHWYLSTMLLSNGVSIVNSEETEVLYNQPAAVEMLTLWGDMVNKYQIMPPNQHSESEGDFLAGKLAMYCASSSRVPAYERDTPFKLGVAMMPSVKGSRAVPIGGASLVIFKDDNTVFADAAWKFIKFMTTKESSAHLSTQTGYLPIYKDALEWPEMIEHLKNNPSQKVAIEQLQYAVAIPEFAALGTSDSELRSAVQKVELGASTPQQALDDAKAVVDQNMKEQQ